MFPCRPELFQEIAAARSYFKPHQKILALADSMLHLSPALSALRHRQKTGTADDCGPAIIRLHRLREAAP
jgi:hypothetical protein